MTGAGAHRRQMGFSYIEVVLAIIILSLALVPALETLQTAFTGVTAADSLLDVRQKLVTTMEQILAEPFASLENAALAAGSETVPSSYSESAGTADRALVYLSRYDGDNADGNDNPFNGTDDGLLWVRVAIENTPDELTTLVAE